MHTLQVFIVLQHCFNSVSFLSSRSHLSLFFLNGFPLFWKFWGLLLPLFIANFGLIYFRTFSWFNCRSYSRTFKVIFNFYWRRFPCWIPLGNQIFGRALHSLSIFDLHFLLLAARIFKLSFQPLKVIPCLWLQSLKLLLNLWNGIYFGVLHQVSGQLKLTFLGSRDSLQVLNYSLWSTFYLINLGLYLYFLRPAFNSKLIFVLQDLLLQSSYPNTTSSLKL